MTPPPNEQVKVFAVRDGLFNPAHEPAGEQWYRVVLASDYDAALSARDARIAELERDGQALADYVLRLEKERDTLQQRNDELVNEIAGHHFVKNERDRLLAEVAALQHRLSEAEKDAERLDWLDRTGISDGHGFVHAKFGDYRYYALQHYGGNKYPTAREIIDRAMQEEAARGKKE